MIQLPSIPLDARASAYLNTWQADIDALTSYADQVAEGKSKFSQWNKVGNATFAHIKTVLIRMCQGARRCGYCEDSYADEVEHIQPKDLYPDHVFVWENYLYACGPCNGPKNSQFAVLHGQPPQLLDVTRARGAPIVPPVVGSPALINPRREDPLHFLFLDLLNTFTFTPRRGISRAEKVRAEYTLRVLRLNERDSLVQARRTAFGTYRARLTEYLHQHQQGASPAELHRMKTELQKVDHQTVWREMQRQHLSYAPLANLFKEVPEALTW